MEKFIYVPIVTIEVDSIVEVTIGLGQFDDLQIAQHACQLHKEHDMFVHVASYYVKLKIDHIVSVVIMKEVA